MADTEQQIQQQIQEYIEAALDARMLALAVAKRECRKCRNLKLKANGGMDDRKRVQLCEPRVPVR